MYIFTFAHISLPQWSPIGLFSVGLDLTQVDVLEYCKTRFFRVPFILRISRAWQVRENNGPRKCEYSSVSM